VASPSSEPRRRPEIRVRSTIDEAVDAHRLNFYGRAPLPMVSRRLLDPVTACGRPEVASSAEYEQGHHVTSSKGVALDLSQHVWSLAKKHDHIHSECQHLAGFFHGLLDTVKLAKHPRTPPETIAWILAFIYLDTHMLCGVYVFEIIAEPNRRAILSLLVSSQRSVGEIERQLHMPQPTVSKHVRVLREAGFVESTVDAQRRLYRLKPRRPHMRRVFSPARLSPCALSIVDATRYEPTRGPGIESTGVPRLRP